VVGAKSITLLPRTRAPYGPGDLWKTAVRQHHRQPLWMSADGTSPDESRRLKRRGASDAETGRFSSCQWPTKRRREPSGHKLYVQRVTG